QPKKRLTTKSSKTSASAPTQRTSAESPAHFMDWFDENRAQLEEQYPEQSAEELLRTARLKFRKFTSASSTKTPSSLAHSAL
ncbi:unnamed protein product, partial [Dicrocoelium dendriticum]